MRLFRKQEDQDEKLIKNMEEYAKKEKAKQQLNGLLDKIVDAMVEKKN